MGGEAMRLPPKYQEVPLAEIQRICDHYGLHELWRLIEQDPPELPFKSDGCSLFLDQWTQGRDLYEGCFIHDLFYWSGRPGDDLGRLKADVWLLLWVGEHVSIKLAEAMFNAVRMGGSEKLPTPWRWGFGRRKGQAR
jgi:hypothetical protein